MIEQVFVYGTLNPYNPQFNGWLVQEELGITEWRKALTKGTRVPSYLPWDYVWFHEDDEDIEGAVLIIGTSEAVLARLDRYEAYDPERDDSLFIRKAITLGDGSKAWAYEWGRPKEKEATWAERSE